MELPPLTLLRVFDAAGRHLSFKRAAEALCVTPSTVSHQIADLESQLGVSLFIRGRGGIRLTPEGAALLADVAPALDRLRIATARIRRGGQPAAVRISANPFFAAEILVPLIADFDIAFPTLAIHVSATEALEDPRDGTVDFCVRFSAADVAGLERTLLYQLFAAPVVGAKLSADPPPRIDFPFHGASAWQQWDRHFGVHNASEAARHFSSYYAAMRAAEQGLGVTLGMLPVVTPWLRSGQLRCYGQTTRMALGQLELVSRPLTPSETTLRAVRDWLITAFRAAAAEPTAAR